MPNRMRGCLPPRSGCGCSATSSARNALNLPVGMRRSQESSAVSSAGHEPVEVTTGAGRDVHARRPRDVREVLLDLALEVAATVCVLEVGVVETVPLVEREHERAARFQHEVDDAHVLLAERLRHVEHDDGDLGLLQRSRRAQGGVEVGALLQVHATADAGGVDEAPQPSAEVDDLVDRVARGAGEFVDDDPLLPRGLVQQRGLAHVRATQDRHTSRSADLVLGDRGDLRQHLHDLVEQVGDAAAVDGGDRVGLAETEVPQRGGLGLVARVVDLVGHEEDGLAALAQQPDDVLVGRGGADHRVHDEHHDIAEVDGDLGLRGHRCIDALRVRLPAAGVDEREPAVHPLALVGDAVTGDAGGVLHDGLAAAEDAVHERRLADVRATHDGDDREGRRELDAVLTEGDAGEQRRILIVQLVIGEARAQRGGALLGEFLVEVRELLLEAVGTAHVLFVFSAHGSLLSVPT